jgi:hypothetical protein
MGEIKLIVDRFSDNGKETLSNIYLMDGDKLIFSCCGMELPDKGNLKRVSCIPKGTYDCKKVGATANIPYEHLSILNVANRSGICVHKANYVKQLLGCIAVGDKFVDINNDGLKDITNSGKTFNVLMKLVPDAFKIEVR